MNLRTVRQATDKSSQVSAHTRLKTGHAEGGAAPEREADLGDLQTQIAMRAYEFYVQRGCREGCAVEDWLDAEREILGRNSSS